MGEDEQEKEGKGLSGRLLHGIKQTSLKMLKLEAATGKKNCNTPEIFPENSQRWLNETKSSH